MSQIISVIVPVYNVEKYLDECIKSIVEQSYRELEIILVDDGSTDKSLEICNSWAKRDERIKVVACENNGVAVTRNTGVSAATGDYVYFVDSDDYIDKNLCSDVLNALCKSGADIVCFDIMRVDDAGNNCGMIENGQGSSVLESKDAVCKLVSGKIHDSFCNKIIRSELFEDISFPDGHMFEDLGTMYKLFFKAEKICFLPKVFYYYRKRSDSIIGTMSINALCDLFLMRVSRGESLERLYPKAAGLCLENTALSALALYDRALWEKTQRTEPINAEQFLDNNKQDILRLKSAKKFRLYYKSKCIYGFYRILKHKIGNAVKKVKR